MEDEFEQFRARAYGRSPRQNEEDNEYKPLQTTDASRTNRRNHPRRSRLQPAATEICSTHYDNDTEVQEASAESQKVRRHSAMGIFLSDSGTHHHQVHRRHHKHRQFLPLAEASPADEGYHHYRGEAVLPVAKSPSYASSRSSVRSDHTSASSTGIYSSVHTPLITTAADLSQQQQADQLPSKLKQLHSRDSGHLSSSSSSLQANQDLIQNVTSTANHQHGQNMAASETSISSRKSTDSFGVKPRNFLKKEQYFKKATEMPNEAAGVRFSVKADPNKSPEEGGIHSRRQNTSMPTEHAKNTPSKTPSVLDPGYGMNRQRRSSTCGVLEKPPVSLLSPSPTRGSTKNLSISPATNRRNSCFVGLPTNSRLLRPTLSPCSQHPYQQQQQQQQQQPVYNTGRRNSAITYLTDTSPFRSRAAGGIPSTLMMRTASGESSAWKQRAPVEQLRESSLENDSRHGDEDGNDDDDDRIPKDDGDDDDDDEALNDSDILTSVTYQILVMGSNGVGKTTLARQLLTSEYLANKNGSEQELSVRERTSAAVRLDGEESIVTFTEWPTVNTDLLENVDACIVVYSVNDRNSFHHAQTCLAEVSKRGDFKRLFLMLVANKQDLVRNRIISAKEGKKLAMKKHCKFIEVSALLDHKVDKVLECVIRGTRSLRTRLNFMGIDEGGTDDGGSQRRSNGSKIVDDCEDDEDGDEKTCFYRVFRSCVKLF